MECNQKYLKENNDDNMISKSTADVFDTFDDSLLSVCSIEHLSCCDCQKDLITKYYNDFLTEEMIELEKNNNQDNQDLISSRKDYVWHKSLKKVSLYCKEKNVKCSIEKDKLLNTLKIFGSKYDLSDPRIFTIVEALMNQMLSVHRMQQYSNNTGILNIWYDKNDNKRVGINPVEELKLKYDEARISAIATLDKITEGEKININLQSINIEDVFKEININSESGEYREIT